jgi:outer membrane receptor protein involved in Fe transport
MRLQRRSWSRCAAAAVVVAPALHAQVDTGRALPQVDVIQQAPLPGFAIPRDLYPGNAQQAGEAARREAGALTLPDFMNRRLQNVVTSDVQGSPFQVDLSYRGQKLSPLLGTPQGLSLYLDGVRMNQPFGDIVSWDLLPEAAIADLVLVPGSNPLYGLNTLAGALVLTTKSGWTHPGGEAELSFGSGQRKRLDFAQGRRSADGTHLFAAATVFDEQGWRDRSPGHLANLFLKGGRVQADSEWSVSLLAAGSHLTGNGLLNESLAAQDWRAIYTAPDPTRSQDTLLTFQGTRFVSDDSSVSLQAWLRGGSREGSTGDVSEDWGAWLDRCRSDPARPACSDPAEPGYVGQAAILHRSQSRQDEAGAALQWNTKQGIHQLAFGGELAGNRLQHDQWTQAATFDANRNAVTNPGADEVHEVALHARSSRLALFASDVMGVTPRTQLTPSLRWNVVRVRNDLGHPEPASREEFHFSSLNPALGATYTASDALTFFGSAAQGNRVPTALELGCADPAQPCTLPTGLQADPALRQVVSRTIEAGVRGHAGTRAQWSAALFRTENRDDIVFLRSGVSQAGYFSNIPRTRRQGLELAAQGRERTLDWSASYSLLSATYESSGVLPGPLSTDAQPNTFAPGTRIAGLPRHLLKVALDWRALPALRLGVDAFLASDQVVSGNEGGNRPELGRLAGYALANVRATWTFQPGWELYARISNVFDRRYANGAVGNPDFFPGGHAVQPGGGPAPARFIAPGAPRTAVIGVRYAWNP